MIDNNIDSNKEVVQKDTPSHTHYCYHDYLNGYEVESKIVFKERNLVVHYPFSTRDGKQKYKNIKSIAYENMPKDLPPGFLKSPGKGYGFTKDLNPILYIIEKEHPKIEKITVSASRPTRFVSDNEIIFNCKDLEVTRPKIVKLNDKQKNEKEVLIKSILGKLFEGAFEIKKDAYYAGDLANYISKSIKSVHDLSEGDMESIMNLIEGLSFNHEFIKSSKIISTKEAVDKIFIEDLIIRFKSLLELKTDSHQLEKKWQDFFADNILFFNFGYVEKFEKERIKGDKSINIPDFIMLNTYNYLDVFEIKTHLTQLLSFDSGRNNFYWHSDASMAIAQAENYIDCIIKEEDTIIKNIRDEYGISNVDAVRPVVYIVASSKECISGKKTNTYRGKIEKKMWNDFRRLNNSLKNINFILYDELLEVFQNMLRRLKGE